MSFQRKHAAVSVDSRTNSAATGTTQATLDGIFTPPKKYSAFDRRQQNLNDALVLFVSCDLIPFSVVDSPYFRGLLEAANPSYQVPTRKHLVNRLLQEKHNEVRMNIKSRLEKADWVSVTLDIWSSRQMRSYIGITGHFIDNWKLNNVVLSCKRFHGRHTAHNIMQEYEEIRQHFNISSKVTNIITDNASNMISAFSLAGFGQIVTSSVADCDDSDSDDLDTNTETDPGLYEVLPADHSSCFAHTLQLVVRDGFKVAEHLNETVKKVSKLVSYVHRSTVATDILKGEKKIESSCATRWNSEVKMIRSVLCVPEEKLNMIAGIPTLTAYDRNILTDMLRILEPFEEATDCTQRQNCVSASFVIPCVRGLRFHLQQAQSNYNNVLVSGLLKSLEKRLHTYEKNHVYQLAAILDPSFKLDWCNSEDERVAMKSTLAKQAFALNRTAAPLPLSVTTGASSPVKKRKKLFSFMQHSSPLLSECHGGRQINDVINTEIQTYLNEPCLSDDSDAMAYWKGHEDMFSHIAKVAKRYLAVPASSASVERAFSIAGKIFRPDRCRMSDANFETLMFIKCNENSS